MKKLMIAAAIVCAAVAVNASNVQWGLAAGNLLDATKIDQGTFYLVYTTGTMDWSKLSGKESFSKADLYTAGATDVWDSFAYSSSKIDSAKIIKPTTLGPDSGAAIGGGTKGFYYVCIDDGGKDIAYNATAKTVNIANNEMAAAAKLSSSAFTYLKAEDVPEPTSGLLLLLGVAGLALRRKQK